MSIPIVWVFCTAIAIVVYTPRCCQWMKLWESFLIFCTKIITYTVNCLVFPIVLDKSFQIIIMINTNSTDTQMISEVNYVIVSLFSSPLTFRNDRREIVETLRLISCVNLASSARLILIFITCPTGVKNSVRQLIRIAMLRIIQRIAKLMWISLPRKRK